MNAEEETAEVASEELAENAAATTEGDSLLNALGAATNNDSAATSELTKNHPLFNENMLMPNINQQGGLMNGPVVGYAHAKSREAISRMINVAFEKRVIDSRTVKFLWSAKPVQDGSDIYQLFAIRINTRDGAALLDGSVITDARQDFSNAGGNEISMTMNSEGARDWKRITGENVGKCVAIVLDDLVYSAPVVNGEIAGGRSSITGGFTLEEAKDLANILKSGKLPAPAVIVQEAVVGPSLGQESITRGLDFIHPCFHHCSYLYGGVLQPRRLGFGHRPCDQHLLAVRCARLGGSSSDHAWYRRYRVDLGNGCGRQRYYI